MSKSDKLLAKLKNGTISADELTTLLNKLGWKLKGGKGSHQTWSKDTLTLVLSPHGKDLKKYQIKQAQVALEDSSHGETISEGKDEKAKA